jgi:hypothetical protein
VRNLSTHPLVCIMLGMLLYWALQHFTGFGTSGMGARQHPGGLAA